MVRARASVSAFRGGRGSAAISKNFGSMAWGWDCRTELRCFATFAVQLQRPRVRVLWKRRQQFYQRRITNGRRERKRGLAIAEPDCDYFVLTHLKCVCVRSGRSKMMGGR